MENMFRAYSRNAAVNYALTYGANPNPAYRYFKEYQMLGGDCTNFISQCLHAGGAPFDYNFKIQWWYNSSSSWSYAWTIAHSLYWYLREKYRLNSPGLKGQEVSDISLLQLGDLIMYESYRGVIYHSAIITSFVNSAPRITQHTPELVNISYIKPKAKKMHFIKISV